MNLTAYVMELESLINRYTILVFIEVFSVILALILVWTLPFIGKLTKTKHKKQKTKRKIKLEKESRKKTIIAQVVISILFITAETFIIGIDVDTLNNLKKDSNQNSIAIYNGDAHLWDDYRRTGALFDFIVDSRNVSLGNSDATYKIDMSKVDEGWFEDSGEFNGKITYGENSKYILKIE